jgi:type I restriction enzyme S subunit
MEKQLIPQLRFTEFSKNWEIKYIKNIAKVVGGGTPSTTNNEYWNGNINWFTPTEIKFDIVSESKRKITDLGLNKSSATLLPKGTILLTTRATIGQVAIAQEECTTNQGFQCLVVNKNNSNHFVFDLIKVYRKELYKRASGSTFKEISKKEIEKIRVLIPALLEQQKIASFLKDVDELITKLTKKKTLLEQYKKGVMQKIFHQELRFKDDDGNEFPNWEEKKLGDITKYYDGTHQTPNYVSKGVPFYSVEHVTANQFVKTKFISEDVFQKENKRVKLEKGDILMTRIGNVGKAKYIDWDVNASFYVSLALIKQNSTFSSKYLAQYINAITFQRELWKRIIHVAFPIKINLGEIGKCLVKLPSIEEQIKIANFLSDIDVKIDALNTKIENSKTFKKGLMQKMFV